MKYCPRCGEEKPVTTEHWCRNCQTKDGLHGYCKACKADIHKEYMKNKEVKERVLRKTIEWQKGIGKEKWRIIRKRCDTSQKKVAWRHARTKRAKDFAEKYVKTILQKEDEKK